MVKKKRRKKSKAKIPLLDITQSAKLTGRSERSIYRLIEKNKGSVNRSSDIIRKNVNGKHEYYISKAFLLRHYRLIENLSSLTLPTNDKANVNIDKTAQAELIRELKKTNALLQRNTELQARIYERMLKPQRQKSLTATKPALKRVKRGFKDFLGGVFKRKDKAQG